jgi:hypothetical protein
MRARPPAPAGRRRTTAVVAVEVVGMSVEGAGAAPSLVDGENNSREPETAETEQSRLDDHLDLHETGEDRGRYDCRQTYRNMEMQADDGETAAFRCDSWDCYCCAHRMRMNLIEDLERLVEERPELTRLLTLTVGKQGPEATDAQHEYITDRFNALRTNLSDEYPNLSYVWIRHEGDENRRAHLHLLVDRYIPQGDLVEMSTNVGLGEVVDIRRVNARNAAKYLTSYLGRGALAELPKGLRRYGSSSDIQLNVRGPADPDPDDRDWRLMMNDYEIRGRDGDPLHREVTTMDLYIQRVRGGPVGLDPPGEPAESS